MFHAIRKEQQWKYCTLLCVDDNSWDIKLSQNMPQGLYVKES